MNDVTGPRDANAPGPRSFDKRILFALFISGFATFAQVFDVQAILPHLSSSLRIPPSTAALTISATTIGIAASVLPWAALSDRIGRIQVLKISLIATAAVSLITPFLPSFEAILINRSLTGIALGGVPAIAMTYLTEELALSRVAVAAGIYVSGNTVGGVFGRLVAGSISELSTWRMGLLAVAVVGAMSVITFLILIPPARGFTRARGKGGTVRAVTLHLRSQDLQPVYVLGFLIMGVFAATYNYVSFRLLEAPMNVSPEIVSLVFLTYFVGAASAQYSSRLSRRLPIHRIFVCGGFLFCGGLLLMLIPTTTALAVGLALFTAGCFAFHAVLGGLSGMRATVHRAQSTALYQLSWLLGTAVLGWLLGIVLEHYSWNGFIAATFLIGVLCTVIGSRSGRPPLTRTLAS